MKKSLLISIFSLCAFISFSQSSATEGKIEFQNKEKVAAVIELPYPQEIIEDAINKQLSQKGVKKDKSRGFNVFRWAKLYEADNEMNDLYFKVERKSRNEKDASVVYLIVAKPGESIAERSTSERYKVDAGINFLNSIVPSVEVHSQNVQIEEQEEVVKKAEKKLKNLEEEEKDLEKRIKNMQDKLEQNKVDQKKQVEEVTRQKSELETRKSKKKE